MGKVVTQVLLGLWDLGGLRGPISRTEVLKRVKKKGEKVANYTAVMEQLKEKGAIAVSGKVNAPKWELTQAGLTMLTAGLQDKSFEFAGTPTVRATTMNALLRWLRQTGSNVVAPALQTVKIEMIDSYETFRTIALETFDRLNREDCYGGLVPIWRMRQAIHTAVSRTQFNDWIMQMQAEQIFYLQTGEAIGATESQKQDSIENEIRGLLFYISQTD